MAETLQIELVTPEKTLFSAQAEMVEAPGADGDFGVLPRHAPLISLLREGVIKVHHSGSITEFPVAGGLAQVDGGKCIILAEVTASE